MDNEFSNLVSKVLSGEASYDEKKSLHEMLLENSEHSLMYQQIKEYWDADVNLISKKSKSIFEENILAQLDLEQQEHPSTFRKLYFRIPSAAAVLFFVSTCSLAYLYTASPQHLYTFSAQATPVEYTLADGSIVMLNKNSSLTYQSDFGDKRRDVQLKGEAFFKVTKDKTRPFSVEALGTKTEVLGTSFNVKAGGGIVTTTLVEGSVRFKSDNRQVLLKPGEEVIFNAKSNKIETRKTDTQYNTVWTSGRYNYKNLTFSDLADRLERIYKLKIEISDSKIANRIVSASFLNDVPVEEILNALEDELEFSYKIKDSTKININPKAFRN